MVSSGGAKGHRLRDIALRGLVLVIFAAAALVVLLWQWPDIPQTPEYQHSGGFEVYYEAKPPECQPSRLRAIKDASARADQTQKCATPSSGDRQEYWNSAQSIRATNASEEALRIAYRQTIIGLLQAALSTFLLGVTAWAAWAAADAAKAAKASVEHAEADATEQSKRFNAQIKVAQDGVEAARAATAQADRAWISVHAKAAGPFVVEGDHVWIDVFVRCVNQGRSPAIGVVWDCGLFASAGEANGAIYKHAREAIVVPGYSSGQVIFPGEKHVVPLYRLRMTRAELIAAAQNFPPSDDPDGHEKSALPAVVAGVHYCLPGETKRRYTHLVYRLHNRQGQWIAFDGSEGSFDVVLQFDGLTGPIT